MKRVTRNRHLNPAEAAKHDAIREKIEQEKPEINARIRQRVAEKRNPPRTCQLFSGYH